MKLCRDTKRRSNSTTLKTSIGLEAVETGESSRPTVASPSRKATTHASRDRQKRPMPTMMRSPPMASWGAPRISGIPRPPASETMGCPLVASRRFREPEVRRICSSPVAPTRIASGTWGSQPLACRNRARRLRAIWALITDAASAGVAEAIAAAGRTRSARLRSQSSPQVASLAAISCRTSTTRPLASQRYSYVGTVFSPPNCRRNQSRPAAKF